MKEISNQVWPFEMFDRMCLPWHIPKWKRFTIDYRPQKAQFVTIRNSFIFNS